MATSAIGKITEFNPEENQEAESYLEKFEWFCEANNIAEEKKKAVFLASIGTKTYDILRRLCEPKVLKEKTFREILTLFKTLGSNNTQRLLSQPNADKPVHVHDPEHQLEIIKTEKLSTGSTSPQSQAKQGATDEWEQALTQEELLTLQELGLGVAVDITAKHPWATKSAFLAKKVKKHELIVINESNRSQRSREQVETYTTIQQGLESSFRPDPTTPINVTVAADYHRSNTKSKTISSQMVLTRTIAFRANDPLHRVEDEESRENDFETNLHDWLVKKKCYPVKCGKHGSNDCGLYAARTNHHCIEYLKELGGVTHYVSSITLGATRYQVTLNSTLFHSFSTSSEVNANSFVSGSTKLKISGKVFQSQSKEQNIGRLPENKDILQFRSKGEAVVKCSYNSLANLVAHPQLRKLLERGINEYIDLKRNGTRGPYHISTAELLSSNDGERRLYWKINWKSTTESDNKQEERGDYLKTKYKIECTDKKDEASIFYLKPVVQPNAIGAHGKYFWIVTDPEDYDRSSVPNETPEEDKSECPVKKPEPLSYNTSCVPQIKKKREPQRYVSVNKEEELVVELSSDLYSTRKAAFKLKNPRDGETYPLYKSQWLPEALCGTQPYLIGREGTPFLSGVRKNKINSVYIKKSPDSEDKKVVMFGSHKSEEGYINLFRLARRHIT